MMSRSLLFERWPRFAFRYRWFVVGAALAVLGGPAALYGIARGPYGDAFSIPGAESQRLFDLLDERFPSSAGDSAAVVVATDTGIADPAVKERIQSFADEIRELPGVAQVHSPYDSEGRISKDGEIAVIDVQYSDSALDIEVATVRKLLDWREQASSEELQVEVGGTLLRRAEMEPPGGAEIVGITAAVVILLLAFGSIVAMGLPMATALLGLVSSFFLVGVGANFFKMPSFTPQFSAMVGIGVGIDYALLVVTRFREAKGAGSSLENAILVAMNTAGRSVLFAGSPVGWALLGLWAAGISAVGYVGTATSLVVALAVMVALLVLPALLSIAGNSIDRWRLPGLHAPVHESESGFGYRLSRVIQRYPLMWFVLTLAGLPALALPALDMRLGRSGAGDRPHCLSARRAYDLLARGFGPGSNGPILLGFSTDEGETAAIDQLPAALAKMENVALGSPASFNQARPAA